MGILVFMTSSLTSCPARSFLILGYNYSKDVEKLYPSIKKDRAGQLVREEVMRTKMTFANVDYSMALRFISKSATSQEEVNAWGFGKWCPRRTKTKGTRPGMTGASTEDDKWTP